VGNFDVQLHKRAKKQLEGLDKKIRQKIWDVLLEMEFDPYGGDYQKLKGDIGHRRRVGDYRILFDIDTDLRLVLVYGVRHRKDAYR
jgi:mRNA interferase RelE/StbE